MTMPSAMSALYSDLQSTRARLAALERAYRSPRRVFWPDGEGFGCDDGLTYSWPELALQVGRRELFMMPGKPSALAATSIIGRMF